MKKVFISYLHSDEPFVRRLVEHLGNFKTSGWRDDADISAGNIFADRIRSAIKQADALVVLVSTRSRESRWVNFEVGAGLAMGVPVIPVVIEGEGQLPEPLRDVRSVDARNRPIEEVVSEIEKSIK